MVTVCLTETYWNMTMLSVIHIILRPSQQYPILFSACMLHMQNKKKTYVAYAINFKSLTITHSMMTSIGAARNE